MSTNINISEHVSVCPPAYLSGRLHFYVYQYLHDGYSLLFKLFRISYIGCDIKHY